MTKIFALGVTGYIGGDALHAIANAHPEYEWTCLVRNSDKGALVAAQYPKTRLVYGDLDSSELIAEESAKADIVCNWADCDHHNAATAIVAGLAQRPATTPSFYIHTSGTAILMIHDQQLQVYGETSSKIYDDVASIGEITSLPPQAWHRTVDQIVLGATPQHTSVRTAIVCPPCIYGLGRGPGNVRSHQVPTLARHTLQRGKGFSVAGGAARWSEVHVQDLSGVYLRLAEEAAAGGGAATWGPEGYYFAEGGESAWGETAAAVARDAAKKGLIESAEVDSLSPDEAGAVVGDGGVMAQLWGQNSRSRASRARKELGWKPVMHGLGEDIPRTVDAEAEALGLAKRHAEVAAGNA